MLQQLQQANRKRALQSIFENQHFLTPPKLVVVLSEVPTAKEKQGSGDTMFRPWLLCLGYCAEAGHEAVPATTVILPLCLLEYSLGCVLKGTQRESKTS